MKLQVIVSDDLVKKIDSYASAIGVSRSSLCAVWIGNAVMGIDKSLEVIENMAKNVPIPDVEKK